MGLFSSFDFLRIVPPNFFHERGIKIVPYRFYIGPVLMKTAFKDRIKIILTRFSHKQFLILISMWKSVEKLEFRKAEIREYLGSHKNTTESQNVII